MNRRVSRLRSALVTIRFELADAERMVVDVLRSDRSDGFDLEKSSLQEALSDELGTLTETVAALLERAHLTAGDDWKEQRDVLLERFDKALDPLRESFGGLHDVAESMSDDAQIVLHDELKRIDTARGPERPRRGEQMKNGAHRVITTRRRRRTQGAAAAQCLASSRWAHLRR